MDDFCRMAPGEFRAWMEAERKLSEDAERRAWERARMVAAVTLSPHLRKGASRDPRKLVPLPWDADGEEKEKAPAREISREEADALFQKRVRERSEA